MKVSKISLVAICFAMITSSMIAQIGIGTTTPDSSALLEISSASKGLLPPRVATVNDVSNPAEGLMLYDKFNNCIRFYNGTEWSECLDGTYTSGEISSNATCTGTFISVTPCSAVSGATENDDGVTANGIEYDWTEATTSGMVNTSSTHALVDIGGQCWMRYNMVNTPSAFDPEPTWVNNTDLGWSGYYTGGPFTNEGRLYQWSAAMNDSEDERAQGICPTGWHVPSDCEWMYLENSLGMTTTDQQTTGYRNSGAVGSQLSSFTSGATNSSGFNALLGGLRYSDGMYLDRPALGFWWSSSETIATEAYYHYLKSSEIGVGRYNNSKAFGQSVRCLKD